MAANFQISNIYGVFAFKNIVRRTKHSGCHCPSLAFLISEGFTVHPWEFERATLSTVYGIPANRVSSNGYMNLVFTEHIALDWKLIRY